MTDYRKILSIMGEGRNVGKTLLACNIIAKFSRSHDVVGLKITPHKHRDSGHARIVSRIGESVLMEETDTRSSKDTGRMLAAGAVKAYLLQTTDLALESALESFFSLVGENALVVCESGKVGALTHTGVSLFVRQLNCQVDDLEKKTANHPTDRVVTYALNGFDFDLGRLSVDDTGWKLMEEK
jgi:hypothetical protein